MFPPSNAFFKFIFLIHESVRTIFYYLWVQSNCFQGIPGYTSVCNIINDSKCTLLGSVSQRRRWHPTPLLLPGKSHGRRSLVGCSPWGCEESDTTERLHFHFSLHALEKEMATHSSVLAWRIPGMGEPGGLPSVGLHRVRHD